MARGKKGPDGKRIRPARDTAGSRAHQNALIRQEALREQLTGMKLLDHIKKDLSTFDVLQKNTAELPTRTVLNQDRAKVEVSKNKVCADILEKKINTRLRLLRKLLPDLSNVQVTDTEGKDLLSSFMKAVLDGPNSSNS